MPIITLAGLARELAATRITDTTDTTITTIRGDTIMTIVRTTLILDGEIDKTDSHEFSTRKEANVFVGLMRGKGCIIVIKEPGRAEEIL